MAASLPPNPWSVRLLHLDKSQDKTRLGRLPPLPVTRHALAATKALSERASVSQSSGCFVLPPSAWRFCFSKAKSREGAENWPSCKGKPVRHRTLPTDYSGVSSGGLRSGIRRWLEPLRVTTAVLALLVSTGCGANPSLLEAILGRLTALLFILDHCCFDTRM